MKSFLSNFKTRGVELVNKSLKFKLLSTSKKKHFNDLKRRVFWNTLTIFLFTFFNHREALWNDVKFVSYLWFPFCGRFFFCETINFHDLWNPPTVKNNFSSLTFRYNVIWFASPVEGKQKRPMLLLIRFVCLLIREEARRNLEEEKKTN